MIKKREELVITKIRNDYTSIFQASHLNCDLLVLSICLELCFYKSKKCVVNKNRSYCVYCQLSIVSLSIARFFSVCTNIRVKLWILEIISCTADRQAYKN